MEILEAFVLNGKEHHINIRWEGDKPLFRASEIAAVLKLKQYHSSLRSFDERKKVLLSEQTLGGPQEILFLTENGLYKFLMQSRKKEAEVFQEWVTDVLISIRTTGKYELVLKEIESKLKVEYEEKLQNSLKEEAVKTQKHIRYVESKAIIESFKDKYLVYIAIVYDIGKNLFIIKIGSTKDIYSRVKEHVKTFQTCDVIKVFDCPLHEMFEYFLHDHDRIKKFKHRYCDSRETYKVSLDDIDEIIRIATHNKFKFSSEVQCKQLIELEKLKLEKQRLKVEELKLKKELSYVLESESEETKSDDSIIDPSILFADKRQHTQTRGEKIQRYTSDGKTLLKTYESYAYAIRDTGLPCASRSAIKSAIKNKTSYKNYRWVELMRALPDDTVQTLDKTVDSTSVRIGFVAMINLDKTKIVQVFCDQKAAAENRKFKGCAAVCSALSRQSISGGHYFKMWFDCNKELQEDYLKEHQLPEKRVFPSHNQVEKLHPITEQLIKIYSSTEEVIKMYKISRSTLKNACKYNHISKGFKWKFV